MAKKELKDIIVKQLEEQKIEEIICADVSKTSSIADYVIIGTGRSGKHAESTMENLKTYLKENCSVGGLINGTANDGWIVFDLGNIIVHLFEPEVRKIYKLEELFVLKNKKSK